MNRIVFVVACAAILQIASALECYSCKGPTCDNEMKRWEKKTCGASGAAPPPNHQYTCLRLSYKDRTTQKEVIERKCALAELKDGKPMYSCATVGDNAECPVCQTDLCNSAPAISFSFVAISGIILALFAPKLL